MKSTWSERRATVRGQQDYPLWLDAIYSLTMAVTIVCILHAGIYLWRNPVPYHYIEVNEGHAIAADAHIRLGPGVKATTLSVGASHVILIERTEP